MKTRYYKNPLSDRLEPINDQTTLLYLVPLSEKTYALRALEKNQWEKQPDDPISHQKNGWIIPFSADALPDKLFTREGVLQSYTWNEAKLKDLLTSANVQWETILDNPFSFHEKKILPKKKKNKSSAGPHRLFKSESEKKEAEQMFILSLLINFSVSIHGWPTTLTAIGLSKDELLTPMPGDSYRLWDIFDRLQPHTLLKPLIECGALSKTEIEGLSAREKAALCYPTIQQLITTGKLTAKEALSLSTEQHQKLIYYPNACQLLLDHGFTLDDFFDEKKFALLELMMLEAPTTHQLLQTGVFTFAQLLDLDPDEKGRLRNPTIRLMLLNRYITPDEAFRLTEENIEALALASRLSKYVEPSQLQGLYRHLLILTEDEAEILDDALQLTQIQSLLDQHVISWFDLFSVSEEDASLFKLPEAIFNRWFSEGRSFQELLALPDEKRALLIVLAAHPESLAHISDGHLPFSAILNTTRDVDVCKLLLEHGKTFEDFITLSDDDYRILKETDDIDFELDHDSIENVLATHRGEQRRLDH